MTARKIYTFRLNDITPDDHIGRVGEITYRDGYLYYHDGATAGGELINGGSSGGGPATWTSVTGKPSFATVATSGSYNDLTNKPTIPNKLVNGASELVLDEMGFLTVPASIVLSEGVITFNGEADPGIVLGSSIKSVFVRTLNGIDQYTWKFGTDGSIRFPDASTQTTAYTGSYNDLTNKPSIPTVPTTVSSFTNDAGYLTSVGTISYNDLSNRPSLFSGEYDDLNNKPASFDGDYNSLTNKPTSRIAVATGAGPGGNLQADSLALAGLNPVTDIPSTWGGDLILQGGVGGANGDLYGEVRIKSGQIGANYEWHFTTDKKIKLPAGGDIVDSTGASVLGSPDPKILTSDYPVAPFAIDLTKQLATIGNGTFTMANGVENQIIYLALTTGNKSACYVTFASLRTEQNGVASSNVTVTPFNGAAASARPTAVFCIFTNGAWTLSNGLG